MRPIGREEVQRLAAAGAQIVEVLPWAEYEEFHLPGALHLWIKELNRETAKQLDRERPVVVYCDDYQ
jgi:rhodanese-related sulfurtransferase